MKIILFLIAISLSVAIGFLISFFWAIKNDQFSDDSTPPYRPLLEDDMFQQD